MWCICSCLTCLTSILFNKKLDTAKGKDLAMRRWWKEYSDRKNDEEDEHVADSLLYDRSHLPRAAPPPESVFQERERARQNVAVEFSQIEQQGK